jgi:SulP family sulfate permease
MKMNLKNTIQAISAGCINGIYGVIFAISIGSIFFLESLNEFVAFGISIALITSIVGAFTGLITEDKRFIADLDTGLVVLIVGMISIISKLDISSISKLHLVLELIFVTSIISSLVLFVLARLSYGELTRYIPFPVMAGFLASMGYLTASTGIKLVTGVELNLTGFNQYIASPNWYQLGLTVFGVASLFLFSKKISTAFLIPAVVISITALVTIFNKAGLCHSVECSIDVLMFAKQTSFQYLSPWELSIPLFDASIIFHFIPTILVISITAALTNLLALTNFEVLFKKEFNPNKALHSMAVSTLISGLLGGFITRLSSTRTIMNVEAGAKAFSGIITAGIGILAFFYVNSLLSFFPKVAFGCLVIYLGLYLMQRWLWDIRHKVNKTEFAQIIFIVIVVANYDYLTGFVVGILLAFVDSILIYNRLPLTKIATNSAILQSTTIRSIDEINFLKQQGHQNVIYRLTGYIFFGSAKKIEQIFHELDTSEIKSVIIDFSNVSGIDRTAIQIFQRILRRYQALSINFYFVYPTHLKDLIFEISADPTIQDITFNFNSFDHALESAEEQILNKSPTPTSVRTDFSFLQGKGEMDLFISHCSLRTVQKGESICIEGDLSEEIFFIVGGSFEINKTLGDSLIRLAKINGGKSSPVMVGEMAFYTNSARSATITATTDALVYVLTKQAFHQLRLSNIEITTKFDDAVIRKLSENIGRNNRLIETLS